MSKATQQDLYKALTHVMGSKSLDQVVDRLERALKVAKRLPKPVKAPTAINRSAGKAQRRLRNSQQRFTPNLELIGRDITVLDTDGNTLVLGILTEIRSQCEYQVRVGQRYEVFFIDSTDQLDDDPDGMTLYDAHSLGDLA